VLRSWRNIFLFSFFGLVVGALTGILVMGIFVLAANYLCPEELDILLSRIGTGRECLVGRSFFRWVLELLRDPMGFNIVLGFFCVLGSVVGVRFAKRRLEKKSSTVQEAT
jgi:hypothetical protein